MLNLLLLLILQMRYLLQPGLLLALIASLSSLTSGQQADRCDPSYCRLPDCYCGGTSIPGGLSKDEIPQFVLLTFDDAVNDLNKAFFKELFEGRTNPNGCPIKVKCSEK